MTTVYSEHKKPHYLSEMINPFDSFDEADNSSNTLWYVRVHTNTWASLLVFPHYFKYDSVKRIHRLHKNPWHTGLCILTSLTLVFQAFTDAKNLRSLFNKKAELEHFSIFIIAEVLSLTVYFIFILTTIWLKCEAFFDIANFLQQETKYDSPSQLSLKKKILFCIWETTTSLSPPLLTLLTQLSESSWSTTQLFQKHYTRFLESIHINPLEHSNSTPAVFASVVAFKIICSFAFQFSIAFSDWTVITYSILLYENTVEYADFVRKPGSSLLEIKHRYEHLKTLSKKIGNWLGLVIFGMTLGSFPYFVSKFYEFVQPPNVGQFLISIYSIGTLLTPLVLGAVIDRKARVATTEWLNDPKHYVTMPSNELQVLLSEVQDCQIGIYGFNLFKFTPGLLGSVISLLITFAVIMLQFKETNN